MQSLRAQNPFGNLQGMQGMQQGGRQRGTTKDSLRHRTGLEDTLTLSYRYIDSTHIYHLDTTVNDIDKFYPLPANYRALSTTGNAAKPVFFAPMMKAGWDPGFHAYDVYRYTWETARFYTTTRPYTEATYQLGTANELNLGITHTQNINQHWNFVFQYRLTSGPGQYKNLKANHNNYSLYTWYESPRKRYHLYAGVLANNIKCGENGGFVNDSVLSEGFYTYRYQVPTNLGNNVNYQGNIFNSTLTTGTNYKDFQFLVRNQYDLGQQDSVVVNDSTTYYLFYARLRMQHTLQINSYSYSYLDNAPSDSAHDFYHTAYGFLSSPLPGFLIEDKWTQVVNDFSLFQYPVAKNPSQYLTEGIALENMRGTFSSSIQGFYNVYAHGEYRNQTRNKKWDIELNGKLYLEGYNIGNYELYASMARSLGRKVGYLEAGFQNVNRTPSFVYQSSSSFKFGDTVTNLSNENNTHIFGYIWQPLLQLKLGGHYYLMTNYTYLKDFHGVAQYPSAFNLLQLSAEKKFSLTRHWAWYGEFYFQQVTGDAPVHVPLFYTRDRFVYEGKIQRKLSLATGIELRYATPYKADMYSPLLGQFFPQLGQKDSPYGTAPIQPANRPDISAFVHFRIRTFYLFTRAENLNTFNINGSKIGFTESNSNYIGYASSGFIFRFGVLWGFVN